MEKVKCVLKKVSLSFFYSTLFFTFIHYFAYSSQLEMGKYSYGNPIVYSWGEGTTAQIGSYCSISGEVKIILGGEHRTDWVTTYPFSALWPEIAQDVPGHPKSKGNVLIGNDVWIGYGALILSGVTIGDGAVNWCKCRCRKACPPLCNCSRKSCKNNQI